MEKQVAINSSGGFYLHSIISDIAGSMTLLLDKNFSRCNFLQNFVQIIEANSSPEFYVELNFTVNSKYALFFYKVKKIDFKALNIEVELLEFLTKTNFDNLRTKLSKDPSFASKTKYPLTAKFLLKEIENKNELEFSNLSSKVEVSKIDSTNSTNSNLKTQESLVGKSKTKTPLTKKEIESKEKKIKDLSKKIKLHEEKELELKEIIADLQDEIFMLNEQMSNLKERLELEEENENLQDELIMLNKEMLSFKKTYLFQLESFSDFLKANNMLIEYNQYVRSLLTIN